MPLTFQPHSDAIPPSTLKLRKVMIYMIVLCAMMLMDVFIRACPCTEPTLQHLSWWNGIVNYL